MILKRFLYSLLCSTVASWSFANTIPQQTAAVQQQLKKIVIDQEAYQDGFDDDSEDDVFRIESEYGECVIDASSFEDKDIDSISIAAYNPNLRVTVSGTFGEHIKRVAFSPQIYKQIGEEKFKCQNLKKEVCCHIWDFINDKGGYYRDLATYDKGLNELTFHAGFLNGADLSLLGMRDFRTSDTDRETYKLYMYACNQVDVIDRRLDVREGALDENSRSPISSVINKVVLPNDTCRFITDSFEDTGDLSYDPIEISNLVLPAEQNGTFSLVFYEDCWSSYYADWVYPTKDLHIENIKALRDVDLARLFGKYIDTNWANDIMQEIKNRDNSAMVNAFMQLMKDGSPAPKGLMYMIMNTKKGQESFVQLIDRFTDCDVEDPDNSLPYGRRYEFWKYVSGEPNRRLYNLNVLSKWLTELEQNQTQNKKLCLFDTTNVRQYIKHRIREKVTQIFVEHEFANNDLTLTNKARQCVNADVLTEANAFWGRKISSDRFGKGSLFGRFIRIFKQFGGYDRRTDIYTMIRIIDVLNNAFSDIDQPKENNAVLVFRNSLIREIKKLIPQEIAYELTATEVHKRMSNEELVNELINELCFFSIENEDKKKAIGMAKLWNVIQSFVGHNETNGRYRKSIQQLQNIKERHLNSIRQQPNVNGGYLNSIRQQSNVNGGYLNSIRQQSNVNGGYLNSIQQQPNVNGRYLNSVQQQPNVNGGYLNSVQQQPNVNGGYLNSVQQQADVNGIVRRFAEYVENEKNKILGNYGEDEIQSLITM